MKKIMAIMTVLAVFTICSCNRMDESKASYSIDAAPAAYGISGRSALSNEQQSTGAQTAGNIETEQRKVIKQGEISFKADDINKTKSFISEKVQELGGYISKDSGNEYRQTLIIRIPSNKFDLLLHDISENAGKFDSKNIDVIDVTEEYIDVSARIKTKKELQNRYIELLKRAASIDEILKVEREIGNLQTEIESSEGRMKYLKDRIGFSTLTVTYYKEYQSVAYKFNFFSKFADGIKNGLENFLSVIIWLSNLWVFIVLIVVIIFLFKLRKWQKKKNNVMK